MTIMMSDVVLFARLAPLVVWLAVVFAVSTAGAVVAERALFAIREARRRRFEARYVPLVQRALIGDVGAEAALVVCPRADRLGVATLLVMPLIEDRDPARIARTRAILDAMAMIPYADILVTSWWWWRRALGLRAIGLLQVSGRTAAIVAAIDDWHPDVRAAALDALTDLRDPASLPAVVARLHDTTLPRGRRLSALAAFGARAEPLLLEFAEADPARRAKYALALAICGADASRPALCAWTLDDRAAVRAAAFDAIGHVGLDAECARLAIDALEDRDVAVRAAAAHALHGWTGPGDAAPRLARHLDDTWAVATRAARSLQSIGPAGLDELRSCSARPDLSGLLARQMLWEAHRT
jgi:HEAT repeats